MNFRALVILILFLLILIFGTRYINCHFCCNSGATSEIPADSKLYTQWNNPEVLRNDAIFDAFKDTILNFDKKSSSLKITGLYYGGEANNTDFDNIGLARAAFARKKMFDRGFRKSIQIDSRMLVPDPTDTTKFFNACAFDVDLIENSASRVEEKDGKIIFYFPFNSDNPKADPNIAIYINELAEEIAEDGGKISLTGHTDNVGTTEVNQPLSVQRAEVIQQLLMQYGIAKDRILVEGKADTEPQADNATEKGQSLNRRVELIFNK